MSPPASLPNALLVQRLDTVLGLSLAKYTSLARSDAPGFEGPAPSVASQAVQPATDRPGQPQRQAAGTRSPGTGPVTGGAGTRPGGDARDTAPDAQQSALSSSSTTLGLAARTVQALLQRYPDDPPPPQLRQPLVHAAALLQALAEADAQPGAPDARTTHAPAGQPASGGPPRPAATPTAQLAQALMNAVQTSGMFFEAALARVAFEGQPAQSLQQHPQAQLPAGTAAATDPTTGRATLAGLSPEHALLVRQQLDVLANQQWQARTEAWPGVPLDWRITRGDGQPLTQPYTAPWPDDDRSAPDDHATAKPWHTDLTLHLPRLGTLQARISLSGQHCALTLQGDSEATRAALDAQADALRAGLGGSGLRLTALQIAARANPLDAVAPDTASASGPSEP